MVTSELMSVFIVIVKPRFCYNQNICGSAKGVKESSNVVKVFGEGSENDMNNIDCVRFMER